MATQSSDEYLKKYLEDTDVSNKGNAEDSFKSNLKDNQSEKASELQFFHFDAEEFPLGMFYPKGTKIMVRPASVKEIQAYSMVDDNNFYDVVEKMNNMLASCVRVKYRDGKVSSYLDVKDGDRFYLIFMIRELTFQKGNHLAVKAQCSCGEKVQIPMKRGNFEYWETDPDIEDYYDGSENAFFFETIKDDIFKIKPPNIGIQKSFTEYIVNVAKEKETPNMSFLKIIPFLLGERNHISEEGIKKKLKDFQQMDMDTFQFLNSAIDKMKFGIKNLKTECDTCGQEVRTEMQFPSGAAGIFVDDDSFGKLIKK